MTEPRPSDRTTSKQDYATPPEFIAAVVARFGPLVVDLAASAANAVCESYFDEREDSLAQDWSAFRGSNLWLNPPFADVAPWAEKAWTSGARVLMLTQASVGSNWFADHVHGKAMVYALHPRLTFVGATGPFPKDLILSCFGSVRTGFDVWRWK